MMLLEFNVGNFLSFKDQQVLRMTIAPEKKRDDDNTVRISGNDVERIAAVYGANSSGKSNLIKAMKYSRDLIVKEINFKEYMFFKRYVDRNNVAYKDEYTYFNYIFNVDGDIYDYGFELWEKDKSSSKGPFMSEWLYVESGGNKQTIIENEHGINDYDGHLSLPTNHADGYRKKAFEWFRDSLIIKTSNQDHFFYSVDDNFIKKMDENLRRYDTGIVSISKKDVEKTEIPIKLIKTDLDKKWEEQDHSKNYILFIKGNKKKLSWMFFYDRKEEKWYEIEFIHAGDHNSVVDQESVGTLSILHILSMMSHQRELIEEGLEPTIVIDELECSIHTLVIMDMIEAFIHSNEKSQLIATTHESRLLNELSRNEIWLMDNNFVDNDDNSVLRPLWSYKTIFDNIDKTYLDGRYKGVPLFTDYELKEETR